MTHIIHALVVLTFYFVSYFLTPAYVPPKIHIQGTWYKTPSGVLVWPAATDPAILKRFPK